jgi:hypothetical protein
MSKRDEMLYDNMCSNPTAGDAASAKYNSTKDFIA